MTIGLKRSWWTGRFYAELLRSLPATGTSTQGLVVGSPNVTGSTQGGVFAFARPDAPLLTRFLTLRRRALVQLDGGRIDLIACHIALYGFPIADRLRSAPTMVHFQGAWASESDALMKSMDVIAHTSTSLERFGFVIVKACWPANQ